MRRDQRTRLGRSAGRVRIARRCGVESAAPRPGSPPSPGSAAGKPARPSDPPAHAAACRLRCSARSALTCCTYGHSVSSSAGTPSPVTAEIAWKVRPERGCVLAQCLEARRIAEDVDAVGGDHLRPGGERQRIRVERIRVGHVLLELAADDLEFLDRIPAGGLAHVDDVEQHLGAFDVSQEAMAETLALVRALDQAGHVGHHEAAVVAERDHAQVGHERGEGVVGDLRLGRRDTRNQRRLAHVRVADDAHVGEQLHPQPELEHLAGHRRCRHAAGCDWWTT